MELEEKFKKVTGETEDETVSLYLDSAKSKVLSVTNRSEMIDDLICYQLELAIVRYNRAGEEGESSHNEGGVTRNYRSEKEILEDCSLYRLSAAARRNKDA